MKILVIHSFYRDRGGEDVLVETEMTLLREAGHAVDLLEFRNPSGAVPTLMALLAMPFNVRSFFRTLLAIRRLKPDVVHVHNWHFAATPSVIAASQFARVPVVHSFHNFRLLCPSGILFHNDELFLESLRERFPWTAIWRGVYRHSRLLTFWLAFTVHLHKLLGTWRRVTTFIVNSEFERKTFVASSLALQPEKIEIKANSLPPPPASEILARQDHFLFIGRLVPEKGVEILLDAFSRSGQKLVLYGYGPLESKVREVASRQPNIEFRGPLVNNEMTNELKRCSALIFPSIWYEGMPMTLVHAFSTGTPVIASNVGAMATMVVDGQNGLHFESANAGDLINKANQWAAMPDSDKEWYGHRSRALFESIYTPAVNRQRLEAIYQSAAVPR